MLLVAVVIIVVVAVIAVGAYVVLSDNDQEMAPGTVFTYDISENGVEYTAEMKIVGQNADEYLIMVTAKVGATTIIEYQLSSKGLPADAKKVGTEEMETEFGMKTVDVWEYTVEESGYTLNGKSYVDSSNIDLSYKDVMTMAGFSQVRTLTDYTFEWQKSYKESDAIGKTSQYRTNVELQDPIDASVICVADCMDDQFGVTFDLSEISPLKVYYLSGSPQGVPTDASYLFNATIPTKDGDVEVETWRWVFVDGTTFTFYYEPNSKTLYRFNILEAGASMTQSFNLI